MKKKLFCLTLVLVLVASLFLTACGSKDTDSGNTGDTLGEPIKIGALTSLSGGLMDYGQQFQRGFNLGLEYATNGTNVVAGRPLEVIWEDTTTVPEVARERAIKLLDEDEIDILVGPASSSDAAAILGLAEEYERVFMLEPAAADFLTGPTANRYIFRTGRNTAQDSAAMAAVMAGSKVAVFAPDSAFGRAYTEPFKVALGQLGGEILVEEYAPIDSTNFAPYITRIINSGAEYAFVIWAGANDPWRQMTELGLFEAMKVSTGAPELAALRNMFHLEGMPGFTLYYHGVAKNPVNQWLIEQHQARFNAPPDVFVSGGMAAAMAIVTALEKTNGSADAEDLIATLRGMEFDSPTGKRFFRAEDHQAQQSLFEIMYTRVDGVDHIVPELVRVIPIEEIVNPVQVTHTR